MAVREFSVCAGSVIRFDFTTSCWTCDGDVCSFSSYEYAMLSTRNFRDGRTTKMSTKVSLPGGGAYTLRYYLSNQPGLNGEPSIPNSFKAIIGAEDGSFAPIVLDPLTDAPAFQLTRRALIFNVPAGTRTVTLTFEVRQVRHSMLGWMCHACALRKNMTCCGSNMLVPCICMHMT